jgi:hypothetical protein
LYSSLLIYPTTPLLYQSQDAMIVYSVLYSQPQCIPYSGEMSSGVIKFASVVGWKCVMRGAGDCEQSGQELACLGKQ